jgi:beta-galactosidase/beta-glucuronidase
MKKSSLNKGTLYASLKDYPLNTEDVPLKEYPRPNLRRASYLTLNGAWDYLITTEEWVPTAFEKKIMVPYAVESVLSGVNHLLEPNEKIVYHKKVTIPLGFNRGRILLHFDGVDQEATVLINGKKIGYHLGGYTKFTIELANDLPSTFDLTVIVRDVSDTSYHSRGKQTLNTTGWFYTTSSGIYKPVWLESVPKDYVQDVRLYPDFDSKSVDFIVGSNVDTKAKVTILDKTYEVNTNTLSRVVLNKFYPWSPDNPYLYQVKIELNDDIVSSYFGVRKFEVKESNGVKYTYLNNQRIFLTGLLDQGYYFLGNLTPRSYQDYENDIDNAKSLGFNCLRVHIKTENDYFYYYADTKGMLLIQDFPNGGTKNSFFYTIFPRISTSFGTEKHLTYKRESRLDKEGRDEFEKEAKEYLNWFNNYPSIIIYTIFNEGWGEFDPSRIYHELKNIEHYRLFDTASGWYDADSDFYSIHTYSIPGKDRKDKQRRPFIISEAGGTSLKIDGHSFFKGFFGHGKVKDKKKLTRRYQDLYQKKLLPLIKKNGLNMIIYTELCDCEIEYNGLYTFDRKVLKLDADLIRNINESLKKEVNA